MAGQLLRKISGKAPIWLLKFLANTWPPFLGAGVQILHISSDYRHAKVRLKRSWYNANYVGTQFGGSIYSMTDPFYMLILINNLGRDYIVWDKAAQIEFLKPGRTHLYAEFRVETSTLDEIRNRTANGDKYIFDLSVDVKDTDGTTIAKVIKTLYVRKKINRA